MTYGFKKKSFEQKHQEDLQRLANFCLMDDDFMSKVFEDRGCTELLLNIILQRTDLTVIDVKTQYEIKNLHGKSVRLDIFAQDSEGEIIDVEVQRDDRGAEHRRARYNSAMMDTNVSEPGEKYENLAETYVIFITENDILKAGLPIYHIERIVKETGEWFGDEAHIIYINAQVTDDTMLGRLMHDFWCTSADDMYYRELADRVRYFKQDRKGVESMCKALEDMRKEEREEGREEGRTDFVRKMLQSGKYSYEEIAELSEFTIFEVKELEETWRKR